MDPLTHTATGLFLSRAGLNRWTPRAAPILLLAANAPDIDVITASAGQLTYLNYHRHLTHSLAAMPLMALLPVLLVRLVTRAPLPWRRCYLAALAGVASHLLLDCTNVYGIRLLLPFSGNWLRLDLTSVVDLWIWAALALALLAPLVARLVGSEIASGAVTHRYHGRGFAIFALSFLLFYNCGRFWLHARAVAVLESRLYQGDPPVRAIAMPDAWNPLRWRGLVETGGFYALEDVDLTGDFDPTRATVAYKAGVDPSLDAARRSPGFRDFMRFSQFPLWRVSPVSASEGGHRVEAFDLRFGTPARPAFVATAQVSPQLQVTDFSFQFEVARGR